MADTVELASFKSGHGGRIRRLDARQRRAIKHGDTVSTVSSGNPHFIPQSLLASPRSIQIPLSGVRISPPLSDLLPTLPWETELQENDLLLSRLDLLSQSSLSLPPLRRDSSLDLHLSSIHNPPGGNNCGADSEVDSPSCQTAGRRISIGSNELQQSSGYRLERPLLPRLWNLPHTSSKIRLNFTPIASPALPVKARRPEPPWLTTSPRQPWLVSLGEEEFLGGINQSDRVLAKKAVAMFGLETAVNLFSRDWQYRIEGLDQLKLHLQALTSEEDARKALEITLPFLAHGLADGLFNVFSVAADLLKFIVAEFLSENPGVIAQAVARALVAATFDTLISRVGDTVHDPRIATSAYAAFEAVLESDRRIAGRFMLKLIDHPFEHAEPLRVDIGRARLACEGMKRLFQPGTSSKLAVSERRLTEFALECLMHVNQEVRDAGRSIVLHLYNAGGDRAAIREVLPRSTKFAHHHPTLHLLNQELDSIMDEEASRRRVNPASQHRALPVKGVRFGRVPS